MSRSYYKIPFASHTPNRQAKKYWKQLDNKRVRQELKKAAYEEINLGKSCKYKYVGNTWWNDVQDKGYVEKEYYDTCCDGKYYKLIRK